jgi:hypothetical protein
MGTDHHGLKDVPDMREDATGNYVRLADYRALQSQQVASADRGEAVTFCCDQRIRDGWCDCESLRRVVRNSGSTYSQGMVADAAAALATPPSPAESADRGEAVAWRIQPKEWNRPPILTRFAEDAEEMRELGATVTPLYATTPPSPAESAVDGRFPAPIRNPEAWPPNYANGYNDALRLATEEGFARPRASAAPSGVSDAVRDAIQHIRDQYPYDLFPPAGESLACKGARMARLTCDNIELEFKRLMEERQPQPGRVEGMVLVPAEPTLAMENAWHKHYGNTFRGRYRSMIAAAPTAGGQEADHGSAGGAK